MLGVGGHLTDSGIHSNSDRTPVGTPTRGPDPFQCFPQGLVHLADMTPCERTKKRAQCGRGHHPKRQHPVGGTGPQPISMINMGPAHQHRCHQRQHLATRIRSSRAISQPYGLVQQLFQTHRDIKVPATNNPASATNDPSSNTTPNLSISFGILFTRSASSAWVTAVIGYCYFPRSERHFTALTPHQPPNPSVDPG